jgi:hypothetical protein
MTKEKLLFLKVQKGKFLLIKSLLLLAHSLLLLAHSLLLLAHSLLLLAHSLLLLAHSCSPGSSTPTHLVLICLLPWTSLPCSPLGQSPLLQQAQSPSSWPSTCCSWLSPGQGKKAPAKGSRMTGEKVAGELGGPEGTGGLGGGGTGERVDWD